MKLQIPLSVIAIAAMILACNMPNTSGQALPTQAPAPTVLGQAETTKTPSGGIIYLPTETETQPAVPPTAVSTALPQETPTTAFTSTPSVPTVTPLKDPVNCRFGPGVEWLAVGALKVGEMATILGRTAGGAWWYVQLPSNPANSCWVGSTVTIPSGNYEAVAIVAPPQAIVTKISLELDPTQVTVPGCTFPYTPIAMKGTISTNGPTEVEWHWETSQGDVSASDILKFAKYDSLLVSDHVKYGAEGNYWVKLVVTKPNSMVKQANYKVVCGP